MVRKVYDILPPQMEAETKPEEIKEQPKPLPKPVENTRPKITYVPPKVSAVRKTRTEGKNYSPVIGILAKVFLVFALIFLVVFLIDFKLAHALITVSPETDTLTADDQIIVDPSVKTSDLAKKTIPGVVITAEKTYSQDFSATGKKASTNRAQGTVKIFNNFTSPQRMIKGTRLQPPLEKFQPALAKDESPWFKTTADVVLPPKASKEVTVVADGVGEKYNIDPSIFSVPGLVGTPQYTFVYAQSFTKFTGGEKGDLPEVLQPDLDSAKSAMEKQAGDAINGELTNLTPPGFTLISGTVKSDNLESAAGVAVGTNTAKFNYHVKTRATAMIFSKADLEKIGKDSLGGKLSAGQNIYDPSFQVSYEVVPAQAGSPAGDTITLKASATALTYYPVNENDLKGALEGKKVSEAEFFLRNQPKIKSVKIEISPFWRTTIPKEKNKIQLNFNFK